MRVTLSYLDVSERHECPRRRPVNIENTLKFLSTFFPNYTKKIFITYINSKQF
jgi:hypothetical protein